MKNEVETFVDKVKGGRVAITKACNLKSPNTVKNWEEVNEIPRKYYGELLTLAERNGCKKIFADAMTAGRK